MASPKDRLAAAVPRTGSAVRLSFDFATEPQQGAELDNPLFAALAALRDAGSVAEAARALGCSYRHLWGALRRWETALGEPLVLWIQGQPARLTEFGHRLLWAGVRARKRMQPHIDALRADLAHVIRDARDHGQELLTMHASHDLALPRLRDIAAAEAGLHLDLRFVGSIDAVRALNAGRCLVAGFHVPTLKGAAPVFARALKPLLRPGDHQLIACARRLQGLMMRAEHAEQVRSLPDLARDGMRFVNRQEGSGTRLLMDHLLHEHRLDPELIGGYGHNVEDSHVAVAASIASGVADVGPGVEAAALEFGLHFVPLIEKDYFLVCLKPNLSHPGVGGLTARLAGPAWKGILDTMPGYTRPRRCGEVLSMAQAPAWWRLPTRQPGRPKARRPASVPA